MSDPYISGFGVEHAEPIEKGLLSGARRARKARGYKGRHADVSSLPGLRRARGSEQYTEGGGGPHRNFRRKRY